IALAILFIIIMGGALTVWIIYQIDQRRLVQVASFRSDFQGPTPRPGWRYLWNPVGEIGRTNNYKDMVWNGRGYAFDEDPTMPRPAPAHYMRIDKGSGHPGHGKSQRGDIDTYAIIAFVVSQSGTYLLTNSYLARTDGKVNGDVNLRVFV